MSPGAGQNRIMQSIGDLRGESAEDAVRRQALRRMRILATGLLCFAAVIFLLTLHHDGFWGFVNAGAEASMVGAIADWFAVTALFRHPLGLPIPHTALIPKRKDELGRGLEDFVGENFLREEIIRERIAVTTPALRVARWLSEPAGARRVVDELSTVVAAALARIRDDHVEALLSEAVFPRLRAEPLAPVLGGLLAEAVEDDLQRGLVDLALLELHEWLRENPETVTDVIEERAPWWTPQALNHGVANRIHLEMINWVGDIRENPQHRARAAFDSWLAQLATSLQEDPETQERAERFKERLLDHPQVLISSISVWNALRRALTGSLRDPQGAVRTRLHSELMSFARTLLDDESLRERIDGLISDGAVFVVERYGSEATAIITHTIERWDGKEASQRIELHVGRDLQFIRINGTIVGGLVGVLIHALTVVIQ